MTMLGALSGQAIPDGLLVKSFDDRIDKSGECWIWTGLLTRNDELGYGRVFLGRKGYLAHRVMYEQMVGPIPSGLTLDHLCRVRRCVNPAHLEPVTQLENTRRAPDSMSTINAAKTHCPKGHAYDAANTYINATDGARICRTCNNAATLAHYHARKAAA